jgi:hypothetical protein
MIGPGEIWGFFSYQQLITNKYVQKKFAYMKPKY